MTDIPEMVERVARALAPLSWAALGLADTLAHKNRRTASLRHARAAIEAMRDPTDAMVEVGQKRFPGPSSLFSAMVDEALGK